MGLDFQQARDSLVYVYRHIYEHPPPDPADMDVSDDDEEGGFHYPHFAAEDFRGSYAGTDIKRMRKPPVPELSDDDDDLLWNLDEDDLREDGGGEQGGGVGRNAAAPVLQGLYVPRDTPPTVVYNAGNAEAAGGHDGSVLSAAPADAAPAPQVPIEAMRAASPQA